MLPSNKSCKTKIACTIGPSTSTYEKIKDLIEGGMSLVRLNMSHCSHTFAKEILGTLRQCLVDSKSTAEVGVLLDLNGTKLRTGLLQDKKPVFLHAGHLFTFIINNDELLGDNERVAADIPFDAVTVGDKIYVDDGLLSFSVSDIVSLECDQYGIICNVDNAGFLGESKGINLPSYSPNKISLTAQDIEDVKFGMDQNVDFITLSCIRTETEIMEVRKILGNTKIKILSKIENREGLERFEAILKISDGIIIDRGYLGVEIDITKIAIVQKNIIHRCQIVGKPVLLSNQILESMKELPRPSRSEASDITSAVVDGTDCIILSGETAIGQYPTESVFWLRKICSEAEHHIDYMEKQISIMKNVPKPIAISESIACSAVKCAREVNAACIIVYTEAGGTARLVAKYRPSIPVVVTTNCQRTARQLSVSFGLTSHFTEECGSLDNKEKSLQNAISFILGSKLAKQGDSVIITCGQVVGFAEGTTTTMRVLTL